MGAATSNQGYCMGRPEKLRLGDVLVERRVISQEQLRSALDQQKRTGRRLGRVLVENGFTSEEKIGEALAQQLGLPYLNLKFYNIKRETVLKLPETQARRFRALVLENKGERTLVGMADPTDLFAYDEISRILKREVDPAVVSESQLVQTIDQVYRRTEEISGLARELEQDLGDSYVDFGALGAGLGAEDAPVVKLLQSVFEDATQVGASDIHIEPTENRLAIRFRIDGALHLQTEPDLKIAPAMALRLKLMSGLDISEKRLPQDGRFNVRIRDQQVDVRISTMPTQYGESVVMRLLNRRSGLLGLDHLGMQPAILERFRKILNRASGMVLVTGPTGSGKTTTLYAGLSELNTPDRKIITVEDPIEYRLQGITQVQVNEKIELSFTRILRSALRQDPDVILVGEIRDTETAHIALRAAITGHMVLSTLHTKDAASAPTRLVDMDVPNYMVATSLQAVIAQRLVRLVCESCSSPYQPTPQEVEWLKREDPLIRQPAAFARGQGCTHCNGTGYRGRSGVYEMLEMTGNLAGSVARSDYQEFARGAEAQLQGRSFVDHALELARAGRTTIAEAIRIGQTEE
jgi:MSHA biogenesis protein MshE